MYTILGVIADSVKQQIVSEILRSSCYLYLSAESATEAIAMAKVCAIDLIVVDHDLENVDCVALISAIKAARKLPVISIARKEDNLWNRESGDLLITSPVYAPELLGAVELFCSRKVPTASSHVA